MTRYLILSFLAALPVLAQPRLFSVSPQWIQRGATLDVTLSGDRLHTVTGIVFSGESGLSATLPQALMPLRQEGGSPAISIESDSGSFSVAESSLPQAVNLKSLAVRISAATNAPLGAREVRLIGSNGVSAPLMLNVAALPQIAESEPNNTLEQAQSVTLPATIEGNIAATETDAFRFKAAKGQVVILEVDAARRGSALDSTLAVADSAGRELARSEDDLGFDSILRFPVPADGEFVALLRDFQYRGGSGYGYRLTIGVLPYVDFVFPFGGRRGKPVELTFSGHNLSGKTGMTLNIAPGAPPGRQDVRLNLPSGLSNPVALDVQDFAEFIEVAAHPTNSVTVPSAVNGRIDAPGDVDYFSFRPDSDQKIVAEVLARRFGSPLDALVLVYANGALVAQNDDASGADARLEIDAKKGADYLLAIRDLTGRGGAAFGYRLLLRNPQPALAAKFFPDAVRLHRGGIAKVRCEIVRTGFDGPVSIAVSSSEQGLPARDPNPLAGLVVQPLVIPAGATSGTLIIHGSDAAPIGTAPFFLAASANPSGRPLAALATPLVVTDKDTPVRQAFLTVLDPAPIALEPITLSATADQSRSATLEFAVLRQPGFAGDVVVGIEGFSAGRDPITKSFDFTPATLKGSDSMAAISIRAKSDSETGTRFVFARAQFVVAGETNVIHSRPVPVTVTQIPFVISVVTPRAFLTLPRPGSTSAVEEVQVKFRADRRGFNGEIPLVLEGIPAGVTVSDALVPAGSAEAAVRLVPTEKAAPGTNFAFTAQGVATHNDHIYRHKSGAVKLFIDAPAPEIAATNSPAQK